MRTVLWKSLSHPYVNDRKRDGSFKEDKDAGKENISEISPCGCLPFSFLCFPISDTWNIMIYLRSSLILPWEGSCHRPGCVPWIKNFFGRKDLSCPDGQLRRRTFRYGTYRYRWEKWHVARELYLQHSRNTGNVWKLKIVRILIKFFKRKMYA